MLALFKNFECKDIRVLLACYELILSELRILKVFNVLKSGWGLVEESTRAWFFSSKLINVPSFYHYTGWKESEQLHEHLLLGMSILGTFAVTADNFINNSSCNSHHARKMFWNLLHESAMNLLKACKQIYPVGLRTINALVLLVTQYLKVTNPISEWFTASWKDVQHMPC